MKVVFAILLAVSMASAFENLFITKNISGDRVLIKCNDMTTTTIEGVFAIEADNVWITIRTKSQPIKIPKTQYITYEVIK